MLSWFRKKDGGPVTPKPDPVGVGKIDSGEPPVKPQSSSKADEESAKLMNLDRLKQLKISEPGLTLLSRYHLKVQSAEVSSGQEALNRDLNYEGYDFEVTADWMVRVMIGAWKNKADRQKRLQELKELLKQTLTPDQKGKLLEAQKQLLKPVSFLEIVVLQEAAHLAR